MLKQWLLINTCLLQILHASQSIETLLKTSPIQSFISLDENQRVITINLAAKKLRSLTGFKLISNHIHTYFPYDHLIAITLADNELTSLEEKSFINFVHQSRTLSFNVSGNKLTKLPKNFLSDPNAPFNTTLKSVFFDHNDIDMSRVPKKFLKRTKSLELLNVSKNKGHLRLSETFFKDKQHLYALIEQGRFKTPPRHKKPTAFPEDLEQVLSDSL